MAKALLAAGANLEAKDKVHNGRAGSRGEGASERKGYQWGYVREDSSHKLCFYIANVSQIGKTALIYASQYGHLEMVLALLAAGADKDVRSEVGGWWPKVMPRALMVASMTCTGGQGQ